MRSQFIQRYFDADAVVGAKLTLDGADAKKTMKEFKQEVKDARTDLLNMQATFGATSKEALKAAKHVAELEDNLKDASETAKLFDPGNKFQVMGNAVRALIGGFTALQGVLALAGVEGDQLQKTLLKVQGALALTEGLNVIADVTKDLKRLGSVLVQTLGKSGLIGIAIAGVVALGAAFLGVFDGAKKLTVQQKALNEINNEAAKIYAKERIELDSKVNALNDENVSLTDKKKIINQLQDQYPNYFKNLDIEGGKVVGLTEGYNALVKAIGLKARATAAGNLLAKQEEELLQMGFKAGITTEEEALAFVARLEKNDDDISRMIVAKAREAIAQRKFFQDIIADSERQMKELGGDPTGGKTTTSPKSGKKTDPKEEQRLLDLQNEKRFQEEYGFIIRTSEQKRLEEEKAARDAEIESKINDNDYLNETLIADNKNALIINSDLQKASAETNRAIAEWEAEGRAQAARDIGNALGALSDLIGKETAAGKVLAIAQAVINTWLGVTEVLKQKSVLPEPMATISRIASITAVVAAGLNAVKNIGKAKVPGAGGGGANLGGGTTAAPLQPRAPGATSTVLDQQQLNQIGNATVRAFVIESDVSSNQERIRRLNRAARI